MENISQNQKIMIVEEEQNTALSMATQLQANDYKVKMFTSPLSALDELKRSSHEYFLLISDMKMIQMPVFEFMRKTKSVNPHIKILLITTFEIKPNEFNMILPAFKVEGLIAKPSLLSEIIPSVNKIFGISKYSGHKSI